MKRVLVRALATGAGVAGLLVGVVGFAHTTSGRPLLRAFTNLAHGGCPFGYDKPASPAERERARLNFAVTHHGIERAASRPALGFQLDQTTRGDVLAAMAKHGVACTAAKGLSDMTCDGVPSDALGSAPGSKRTLWLTFGERSQLLSVIAISRDSAADAISSAYEATARELDQQAGPATTTHGDASPAVLSSGALRQASAEFRFSNYYALTRVTNLGTGFVLTEEYRSLPG
jgi:hypothetical protein